MASYRIQIASDVDYENLIAEIYVEEKFVALISHEDANGPFQVEFPGPEQNQPAITRRVELAVLLDALYEAKEKLCAQS